MRLSLLVSYEVVISLVVVSTGVVGSPLVAYVQF